MKNANRVHPCTCRGKENKKFQKTKIRLKSIPGLFILVLATLCLAACGKDANIPDNRTKEEYQAEQNFKRFFDFLAAEEKDFSDVESYFYTVDVGDREGTSRDKSDHYVIDFKRNQDDTLTGDYRHQTKAGNESSQTVALSEGKISLSGDSAENYITESAIPVYRTSAFEKLEISDYRLDHPETYMKTVSYRLTNDSEIVTSVKKYFAFDKADYLTMGLTRRSENEYSYVINVPTEKEQYYLALSVTFKGEWVVLSNILMEGFECGPPIAAFDLCYNIANTHQGGRDD